MSHTLLKTMEKLREAVILVENSNIVMFGSCGDRGAKRESVWPADYEGVTLTNLERRPDSTETNSNYYPFQGKNVSIPAEPSYLGSQKHACGSFVATALAAGVAALVLSRVAD